MTTVTFEEQGEETHVVITELFSTKEALDEALEMSNISWFGEPENRFKIVWLPSMAGPMAFVVLDN